MFLFSADFLIDFLQELWRPQKSNLQLGLNRNLQRPLRASGGVGQLLILVWLFANGYSQKDKHMEKHTGDEADRFQQPDWLLWPICEFQRRERVSAVQRKDKSQPVSPDKKQYQSKAI